MFPLAPCLCVTREEIDELLTRVDAVIDGLDRRFAR